MHIEKVVRVLGFDFGLKHIGVAFGQVITKTAKPLLILSAKNGEPDWNEVKKIANEWKPDACILGIPYNMDGTEQPMTERARIFGSALKEHLHLPVFEVNEVLSTRTVREQVFSEKGFRGLKKERLDSKAAQLIVEDWLRLL